MNLFECYSYKTFYYILKDISNLDIEKYKHITDNYDPDEFKSPDFELYYDSSNIFTKDIDMLKTKYGYFTYHGFDEIDEVREFLKQNSKVKPCGVFGSHRVGDVYIAGVAENGEVKRLLYFADGEAIIEGEPTEFEIENNLHVDIDDFESQIKFFKEETMFEYAKWFAGFDIENEDVEIEDMIYYEATPFSDKLPEQVERKIIRAFQSQKLDCIGIILSYKNDGKELIISCQNVEDEKNPKTIFCDHVYGLDKKELKISFKRCINAILSLDLNDTSETMYSINNYYAHHKNKKCNIVCCLLDTERKFMVSVTPIKKKGKFVKWNFFKQLFQGKIYYQLDEQTIDAVCERALQLLK